MAFLSPFGHPNKSNLKHNNIPMFAMSDVDSATLVFLIKIGSIEKILQRINIRIFIFFSIQSQFII